MNKNFIRHCPKCNKELKYAKLGQLNVASKNNSMCRDCSNKNRIKKPKNHPEFVIKNCIYCLKDFKVSWKNRKHKLCNNTCSGQYRGILFRIKYPREELTCHKCNKKFEIVRKENVRVQKYCSLECWQKSQEKHDMLSFYATGERNNFTKHEVRVKIKKTKLARYGDENYNNMEKTARTCLERYGVHSSWCMPSSNGKRISSIQRKVYEYIKTIYSDAELEKYLVEERKSVDIFIPSLNTIIEVFGDFWHMNPIKYKENDYNGFVCKIAKEIWQNDKKRIDNFLKNDKNVIILWEREIRNDTFVDYLNSSLESISKKSENISMQILSKNLR